MMQKKLFVFDLDNTLAPSKGPLYEKSIDLTERIVKNGAKFAILTSGGLPQIQEHSIPYLSHLDLTQMLFAATLGTKLHYFNDFEWKTEMYHAFSPEERAEIRAYIDKLAMNHPLTKRETNGPYFDDRETLLTYSVLGINAPREDKVNYDPDYAKRKVLKALIEEKFPHLQAVYGGKSSLDITHKNINKKFGLAKILEHFSVTVPETVYIGDEFSQYGNDLPLREIAGLDTIETNSYLDTFDLVVETFSFLK